MCSFSGGFGCSKFPVLQLFHSHRFECFRDIIACGLCRKAVALPFVYILNGIRRVVVVDQTPVNSPHVFEENNTYMLKPKSIEINYLKVYIFRCVARDGTLMDWHRRHAYICKFNKRTNKYRNKYYLKIRFYAWIDKGIHFYIWIGQNGKQNLTPISVSTRIYYTRKDIISSTLCLCIRTIDVEQAVKYFIKNPKHIFVAL